MNRAQMISSIDSVIDIAKRSKENENETVFFIPKIEDLKEEEKLDDEYSHLGFFISSHPLDNYKIKLSELESIDSLQHKEQGEIISLGGLMMNVIKKITKKKTEMAFFTLEDLSGRVDVVVFPGLYAKNKAIFENKNLPVQINAKVEKQIRYADADSEEEEISITKLILMSIKPLEESEKISRMVVSLTDHDDFYKVRNLLTEHPGDVNIALEYRNVLFNTEIKYSQDLEAMQELESSCNVKKIYDKVS